jgi:hypothetical protein
MSKAISIAFPSRSCVTVFHEHVVLLLVSTFTASTFPQLPKEDECDDDDNDNYDHAKGEMSGPSLAPKPGTSLVAVVVGVVVAAAENGTSSRTDR